MPLVYLLMAADSIVGCPFGVWSDDQRLRVPLFDAQQSHRGPRWVGAGGTSISGCLLAQVLAIFNVESPFH